MVVERKIQTGIWNYLFESFVASARCTSGSSGRVLGTGHSSTEMRKVTFLLYLFIVGKVVQQAVGHAAKFLVRVC